MANIHVLAGDGNWHWQVAVHVTIPNTNNDVNVNYRTALINSGLGGGTIMDEGDGPGQINTAELGQIQTGQVYEETANFPVGSGGQTPAELQTALLQFCSTLQTSVLADLQTRLRFFGHTESEA